MRSSFKATSALLAAAGPALVCFASVAWAGDASAPITVAVTSSLSGQKGLGRILSAADSGNAERTASDVENRLGRLRWLRMVSNEPEALVSVQRRERIERRRTRDKEGRESIEHRYSARGTVEVGGQRSTVDAEIDFTEGPYSTRNDDDQFAKVADKLVEQITDVIFANLDVLRPNRPEAGFTHTRKYKLLVKGDGLEVQSVEPGSPAERAGLQVKDRIRRIDTEKGTDQMSYRVHTWWTDGTGTRATLEIERNKQRQSVEITLLPRNNWAEGGPSAQPFTPTSGASTNVSLKPGMSELDVVKLMGQPREKVAFGAKSLWRYDAVSITFQNGRLVDMK